MSIFAYQEHTQQLELRNCNNYSIHDEQATRFLVKFVRAKNWA